MTQKRRHLAMSEPVEGASGKTGSWRTYRPELDRGQCNECGLCLLYCPESAISENHVVDLRYCKGCGICANECPKKAITMKREEQ